MKITESKVKDIIREELLNEFTTTGIDVPRIVSLRRPTKKRSKAKDPMKRLEKDLAKSEKELQKLEKKLNNPKFISNAKPEVVNQVKNDFELERQKAESIRENLVNFK